MTKHRPEKGEGQQSDELHIQPRIFYDTRWWVPESDFQAQARELAELKAALAQEMEVSRARDQQRIVAEEAQDKAERELAEAEATARALGEALRDLVNAIGQRVNSPEMQWLAVEYEQGKRALLARPADGPEKGDGQHE